MTVAPRKGWHRIPLIGLLRISFNVLPPRSRGRFTRVFPSFVAMRWAAPAALRKVGLQLTQRENDMKRIALAIAAALLPAGIAVAADTGEAPVAVEVRGMSPYLAERIQREAAKGPTALRRYLQITYPVLQLRVDTVLRDDTKERFAKQEESQRVALAEPEAEGTAK